MSSIALEIRDLPIAPKGSTGLGLRPVTVADAFRHTLDALMRAHRMRGVDLTQATGLSSATVTKLRNGERGASFEVLEMLRSAFGVTPAELFDPDRALAQIGLARAEVTPSSNRHVNDTLAHTPGDPAHSDSSLALKESDLPNGPLFRKLRGYWEAMEPAQHAQLVRLAWELSSPAGEDRQAVGFKRG
jgi:transcriptional regulator with XRE-family HTH domain